MTDDNALSPLGSPFPSPFPTPPLKAEATETHETESLDRNPGWTHPRIGQTQKTESLKLYCTLESD